MGIAFGHYAPKQLLSYNRSYDPSYDLSYGPSYDWLDVIGPVIWPLIWPVIYLFSKIQNLVWKISSMFNLMSEGGHVNICIEVLEYLIRICQKFVKFRCYLVLKFILGWRLVGNLKSLTLRLELFEPTIVKCCKICKKFESGIYWIWFSRLYVLVFGLALTPGREKEGERGMVASAVC